MEVIFKEGMLYLQGAKFGKRTWRKIWMVLFKPSSTGVGRLEFCSASDGNAFSDQLKASRQKTSERKVVRLTDCLSVTPALKESCPARCTAFYLNTTQSTYTFASVESQSWIHALSTLAFQRDPGDSEKGDFEGGNGFTMEDNDLYSSWQREPTLPPDQYKVKVQSTEVAKRCKLSGEYIVFTDSEALELLSVNTSEVIYSWPYKLLRKFGQVEGGFCIEAGRRCDSGEGVFTFLTPSGPQILQAIMRLCSLQMKKTVQPSSVQKRSSLDMSSYALPAAASHTAAPAIYSVVGVRPNMKDDHACQYSAINLPSAVSMKNLCLIQPYLYSSKEDVGGEGVEVEEEEEEEEEEGEGEEDEEDDRCHSLEAVNQDSNLEDDIYYNLRRTSPSLMKKTALEDLDCNYNSTEDFPSSDPFHLPLEISSSTLGNADPFASAMQQSMHLPPADNHSCAAFNAQAVDDRKDPEEENRSTVSTTPTKAPGSFKQRLAEIISKDLAKFQPPLPYGAGSPMLSRQLTD
ncbi:docking protein 3-like [Cyprinodon tularosa]|uniref:docking protein 3-like n=1 Tax=Cyprinodon tularosa TaxID=77115 RepID=UPI0018E26374|nr:docking protein 3-like [Cyprinodon tularosa]